MFFCNVFSKFASSNLMMSNYGTHTNPHACPSPTIVSITDLREISVMQPSTLVLSRVFRKCVYGDNILHVG